MTLGKRGSELLPENIIFIVLNLVFIGILMLFLSIKSNDAYSMEEGYAKKIALILDSAKPGMVIHLNMEDAIAKAQKNSEDIKKIVSITGNAVTVKLRAEGGYSYSFFNNVDVSSYIDDTNNKEYVFTINKYNENA